jgi:hypothetical protein
MIMDAILGGVGIGSRVFANKDNRRTKVVVGGDVDRKLLVSAAKGRIDIIPIAELGINRIGRNGDVLIKDLDDRVGGSPADISHDHVDGA